MDLVNQQAHAQGYKTWVDLLEGGNSADSTEDTEQEDDPETE